MTASRIYISNPSETARTNLAKFFKDNKVKVEWAASKKAASVVINWPGQKKISCKPGLLHAGGRISCADAFITAEKLNTKFAVVGELMNHLDIKIGSCQLGCFD